MARKSIAPPNLVFNLKQNIPLNVTIIHAAAVSRVFISHHTHAQEFMDFLRNHDRKNLTVQNMIYLLKNNDQITIAVTQIKSLY